MPHRLIAVLLGLALSAAAAAAQTRQYGNVIYDMPGNWAPAAALPDRLVLEAGSGADRCPACRITIGPAAPNVEGLDGFLAANSDQFLTAADRARAAPLGTPVYFMLHGRETAMTAMTAGGRLHAFAAITLPDRYQTFGFSGDAATPAALDQSLAAFESQFSAFLGRARFVSLGQPALMPAAVPGKVSGLWWGTSPVARIGADGTMQMQVRHTRMMFWDEGYVYLGTPPRGVAPPAPRDMEMASDPRLGVYRQSGDRLLLTFADGRTEVVVRRGKNLELRNTTLFPVVPLADGENVAGRLLLEYPGQATDLQEAGVLLSVQLDDKGRFRGRRLGEIDLASAGPDRDAVQRGLEGRYAVRDGLMVLTPGDGAPAMTALAFRSGDDILIGTAVLDRQPAPSP